MQHADRPMGRNLVRLPSYSRRGADGVRLIFIGLLCVLAFGTGNAEEPTDKLIYEISDRTNTGYRSAVDVRAALQQGADPNPLIDMGGTGKRPLLVEAIRGTLSKGRSDFVAALLEYGAAPNVPGGHSGGPPLHVAAAYGFAHQVELLIAHGADVNLPDAVGNRPLHVAAGDRDPPDVFVLLAHGADPNVVNAELETPLLMAVYDAYPTIVQLLLDHGARVEPPHQFAPDPLETARDLLADAEDAKERRNLEIIIGLLEEAARR